METTLFNKIGKPAAYIADDGETIEHGVHYGRAADNDVIAVGGAGA